MCVRKGVESDTVSERNVVSPKMIGLSLFQSLINLVITPPCVYVCVCVYVCMHFCVCVYYELCHSDAGKRRKNTPACGFNLTHTHIHIHAYICTLSVWVGVFSPLSSLIFSYGLLMVCLFLKGHTPKHTHPKTQAGPQRNPNALNNQLLNTAVW